MGSRKSIIWLVPEDIFTKIVNKSSTIKEILLGLNISPVAGNYKTVNKRISFLKIDLSHFKERSRENRKVIMKKLHKNKEIPLNKILVPKSTYSRRDLKRRLIKGGILENKCSICMSLPEWQGKELVLQLDHINGIFDDNTLSNLRIVCPNCHTQTSTWGMKGRCKPLKNERFCCSCFKEISKGVPSGLCNLCCSKTKRKVERPSLETLLKLVSESNYCAVGRKYGVSDNAIRKWIKNYEKEQKPVDIVEV